jgi:hypothetical protein
MYPPPYGQPSYPPQAYPYPQPPRRTATPRVVGIIGVVFAWIGLGSSAVFTFGPLSDIQRWSHGDDLGAVTNWLYAWMALSAVVFGLHFVGSLLAIMYKQVGPKLLTSYAVSAIALLVTDLVMVHTLVPKHFDHDVYGSVAISHTVFSAIAFPWPVVVLALINSRRSREACT